MVRGEVPYSMCRDDIHDRKSGSLGTACNRGGGGWVKLFEREKYYPCGERGHKENLHRVRTTEGTECDQTA